MAAQARKLYEIAAEIRRDWMKVNPHAVPYLEAMESLSNIDDYYGCESAQSVVIYFLSNASTWRGETAKRIKLELKELAKLY